MNSGTFHNSEKKKHASHPDRSDHVLLAEKSHGSNMIKLTTPPLHLDQEQGQKISANINPTSLAQEDDIARLDSDLLSWIVTKSDAVVYTVR